MSGETRPMKIEDHTPLWTRFVWWVWAELHWPADVRQLKREGWKHVGFRKWESP
jgi:hypothetical protein